MTFIDSFKEFPFILYSFAFFVGMVLASFGGLLAYRIPHIFDWLEDKTDHSLGLNTPSSHCEGCKKPLSYTDLVPLLGYLISSGKCRSCGFKVPAIYPLMEVSMGVIFTINLLLFGYTIDFILISVLTFTIYVASHIDWNTTYIPDFATSSMLFLGLTLSPITNSAESAIYGATTGWLLFSLTFWLIGYLKGLDAYSAGDVAFGAMAGAWLGLEFIMEHLLLSSIIFIAMAAPLRKLGKVWVPMGPALAFGLLLELWLIQLNIHILPIPEFYF